MTQKTPTKAEAMHEGAAGAAGKLQRRFPTIEELRRRARRRVPRFAFDFVDGGANDEQCARRNATALSAVELLPRYCIDRKGLSTEVELFGPLADNTCYITTDKTGRFLLSASYQGSKLAVNPIGSDGIVWPPQQIICTELKSHSILVDSANRYALPACLGGNIFYQWQFNAETGRLTPSEPPFVSVEKHSGPRHFVFHPNGRLVYLLNEHAVTIYVYDYDPGKGTLTEKQVVNALTPTPGDKIWATDIHIAPNGTFLYAAERGSSTLAMLKVDPVDGTLSLTGHGVTEKQPRGFAIDPIGRFLYCTGQLSTRMSSYAIDGASGNLAKLNDYPVRKNPNWIEIVSLP